MPKSDRSERKKSRRSRRAEAEQAELVAAADEEEGTVIASGGEDDAQNLRARRVAILGVSVASLCGGAYVLLAGYATNFCLAAHSDACREVHAGGGAAAYAVGGMCARPQDRSANLP